MKLLSVSLLLFSLSTFASAPHSSKHLIVKLKNNQNIPSIEGIEKINHYFGNLYKIKVSNPELVQKRLEELQITEYIEKDFLGDRNKLAVPDKTIESSVLKNASIFNDTHLSRQWHLEQARRNGISALEAYENRRRDSRETVIVAVVDTGVDYNHEDLRDVIWTNEGEIPGNGIDDDGNGYIDDIHGINTLKRDRDGVATGEMMDTHGHGTHVSGIIGASQNNNRGIAGVASNVRIMGIRTVPNSGDEKDTDVIESFLYAAKNGAKLINCSFGKSHNEGGMAVSETIDYIFNEYGTIVVAAAGNDGKNIDRSKVYPASFENDSLIVVASTTNRGRLSYFSNYGVKNVDIAAPGSSIYSTVPGNRYQSMSGTSMASPVLTGLAAEVLSRFPEMEPSALKKNLMDSVTKVRGFKRKVTSEGIGDLQNSITTLNL